MKSVRFIPFFSFLMGAFTYIDLQEEPINSVLLNIHYELQMDDNCHQKTIKMESVFTAENGKSVNY